MTSNYYIVVPVIKILSTCFNILCEGYYIQCQVSQILLSNRIHSKISTICDPPYQSNFMLSVDCEVGFTGN